MGGGHWKAGGHDRGEGREQTCLLGIHQIAFFGRRQNDFICKTTGSVSTSRRAVIMFLVVSTYFLKCGEATLPLGAWWCVRGVRSVPERTTVHNGHDSAWSLWRDAPFRRLLILNWFMTASWDLHAFMVPVLAHERGHLASTIGLILGSFAAAATLSRLLLPALARWMREEFLIAGALTLAGAMFALYPFTRSALTMGLCSFVLGLVLGGIQPTVLIILHHITPAHRQGDALAMRLMTVNASSVVMPMVFGAAGGMFSISSVFWAVAAVVAMGSAFGFSFKKRPGTIE
jgi:predicted MFS family arabinose efflux permease